jgi:hypothetical protein
LRAGSCAVLGRTTAPGRRQAACQVLASCQDGWGLKWEAETRLILGPQSGPGAAAVDCVVDACDPFKVTLPGGLLEIEHLPDPAAVHDVTVLAGLLQDLRLAIIWRKTTAPTRWDARLVEQANLRKCMELAIGANVPSIPASSGHLAAGIVRRLSRRTGGVGLHPPEWLTAGAGG